MSARLTGAQALAVERGEGNIARALIAVVPHAHARTRAVEARHLPGLVRTFIWRNAGHAVLPFLDSACRVIPFTNIGAAP